MKEISMPRIGLVCLIVLLISCSQHKPIEIEREMNHYSQWILHGQYDSMVSKFTLHGELASETQHSIYGHDSIAEFFRSLEGATVIKYEATPKSTIFKDNTAIQDGSYVQFVTIPSGDTLELAGDYITTWTKVDNGEWLIQKMYTHHYTNLKE